MFSANYAEIENCATDEGFDFVDKMNEPCLLHLISTHGVRLNAEV